tara:strand:+ start:548 stop:697 length:150 start_codon:yes stop_codon:yes gene_type:complete
LLREYPLILEVKVGVGVAVAVGSGVGATVDTDSVAGVVVVSEHATDRLT